MDDLDHPALIEGWKQTLDAAYYENILNKDVKILSIQGKHYRNEKHEYWPTSAKESLNWLPFFDIMEFTGDTI